MVTVQGCLVFQFSSELSMVGTCDFRLVLIFCISSIKTLLKSFARCWFDSLEGRGRSWFLPRRLLQMLKICFVVVFIFNESCVIIVFLSLV